MDVGGDVTIGDLSFGFGSLSPDFGYAEIGAWGAVVLPRVVGQTGSVSGSVRLNVSVQTPFRFDPEQVADPTFETFTFSGQGIATVFLARKGAGPDYFRVTGYEFRFEETAAPVPEPATMTLLGTGLVAAAIQRRRKQKRAQTEGL